MIPYRLLSNPTLYHYLRQGMTGGIPFKKLTKLYGLTDPSQRVADLGCGPADILRYLNEKTRPDYYLGVDISDAYLGAAMKRAGASGIEADFLRMDLNLIPSDQAVRDQLIELLERKRISRVLLLGVLHHIPDEAAAITLDLIRRASCVNSLVTWDIVTIEGQPFNNLLCRLDRGEFVRDEAGYDRLASGSGWPSFEKHWTTPGVSMIKYIHYVFNK